MLAKNTAGQGVYLFAWDTNANAPKTGDAANITGSWSLDGGAPTVGFGTAHPTEIGGGVYWQPLAQVETNCNALAAYWASTTAGVTIQPQFVLTDRGGVSLAASQHVIVDSGTVTTVTNQLTAAQIATGVWQDTTAGDFTTALSVGKSVMNGVALGTGLTVNALTTNNDKTGYSLAANQHVIVDSGTVTTLTNLPAIPANWLTAAGINAGALNGKGDWLLAANVPANFAALLISAGGHISNVDTLTTYTGNTVQTGDSFSFLTSALTESYAAKGAQPTLAQALYAVLQKLYEASVVGTTETIKKLDGATTAATETLNDATNPTSVTRAT